MRKQQIHIRLTEDEKMAIEMHALEHETTVSQYMIASALADEYAQISEERAIILELRKIGNNLNQIAKALHTQQYTKNQTWHKLYNALIAEGKQLDLLRTTIHENAKAYDRELRRYHDDVFTFLKNRREIEVLEKKLCLTRLEMQRHRSKRK